MKSVQQSWSGMIEVSKVPMRAASAVISLLSMPTNGRSTGSAAASPITARLASVCEATCPRLSPVTSASAPARRASASAMRSIMRR